ncbi:hypothetical protein NC652_020142 [Populus alba x Populus x berolinensis]|nr:hypothetical protein NC652_020142 [Populus alba x Populus x berolinensis]
MYAKFGAIKEAYAVFCDIERIGCCLVECDDFRVCSLEVMNLFEEMQQMAHELMKRMPFVATASMWGSHLVSCRIHGNLELAEIAAKNLFEMEP